MDEQPKHTPGPYAVGVLPASRDAALYSAATGETIAIVRSGATHADAPTDETALQNAALLRAAPQLRESLERVLGEDLGHMSPVTANAARQLLAEIGAGVGPAFIKERDDELRFFEETLDAQIREMGLQRGRGIEELEEEEEMGHSLG
jgi:hypothetical protein